MDDESGGGDAPAPPIISIDGGDINFYGTVEDAQRYLEAVDVRDGVYQVFDSVGRPLVPRTDGERVLIELDAAAPDPDELARRLRSFVRAVGPERIGVPDPDGASLPQLVDRLTLFLGLR